MDFNKIIVIALVILALGFLNNHDRLSEIESQHYAESVCIWQSQVDMGTPKVAADGHPDYENRGIECK